MTSAEFSVRPATIADVEAIARHRAEMFRDIHSLGDELVTAVDDASRIAIAHLLDAGEYLGWLVTPAAEPDTIVAGAGIRLRPALPSIQTRAGRTEVITGQQGLIVNVYTERPWRRRGLAALVMRHVLEGARAHRLASIVLHASRDGRALYESMGFVPTNEMRYAGGATEESQ
ncbi:MAG: GNAT family N-acetyltransferase [bacterium]